MSKVPGKVMGSWAQQERRRVPRQCSPPLRGGSRGARLLLPAAPPPRGAASAASAFHPGSRKSEVWGRGDLGTCCGLPDSTSCLSHPPTWRLSEGHEGQNCLDSGGTWRAQVQRWLSGHRYESVIVSPNTTAFYAHESCSPINSQTHQACRSPLPNKPALPSPVFPRGIKRDSSTKGWGESPRAGPERKHFRCLQGAAEHPGETAGRADRSRAVGRCSAPRSSNTKTKGASPREAFHRLLDPSPPRDR